ncbi:hypothetical protein, partial [Methylosinus sp. R-45379]|uniref:hypothetical protein n=1 Tax=Methylosinus sp. R-45379 TaxID=980563 RepID=UPI0018DC2CB6
LGGGSPPKEAPRQNEARDVAQNVTSYGQQGGITAGTVNIGPQRLTFSQELGRELLSKMPVKKNVLMQSTGGNADQLVATDIENFLIQNGYNVTRRTSAALAPPPDKKIVINDLADQYILVVAPSAN